MNYERWFASTLFFTILLSQMLMYPDLENIVTTLGLASGIADSTLFITAEYTAFIIAAVIWGSYSDKIGDRKKVIQISSLTAGTAYLSMTLFPVIGITSVSAFILIRMLQGAAVAGAFTTVMTTFLDMKGGNGKNMGAAGFGLALAPALGFPLGGALSSINTLAPLYATGTMFILVAIASTALKNKKLSNTESSPLKSIKQVTKQKQLIIPYSFHLADRLSGGIIALAGTFYLRDVIGLNAGAAGGALFALFLPYALLQYPSGLLTDKIGRNKPLIIGSMIYGLGIMTIGLTTSLTAVLAILAITGVGGAIMVPASLAMVGDLSQKISRATSIGAMNMFGSIGYLLGTAAGGIITSLYSYTLAFALFGAVQVLIATTYGLYLLKQKKE